MRALAVALGMLLFGQPTFKTGVDLVTVPVSVMTRDHNNFIGDLTPADFQISENGEKQVVTMATRERRPVSLCFVIDSSGSMALGNRRELAMLAVDRLAGLLQPDDEIAMVFFADTIEERLSWTRVSAIKALNWSGWVPHGNTPLNDGLRLGFRLMDGARNPRQGIVLVSDGFENASRESTSSIVKTRRQSEISIYGIGVGSANIRDLQADAGTGARMLPAASSESLRQVEAGTPGAPESVRGGNALPNFDYLETLVGDSGGSVSRVLSQVEVINAAKNITTELQFEYVIGYTPSKPFDGKYRKLKVEVNRRSTFVRHRGGYLAMPLQQ
jgi:VWFA-related protein